MNLPNLEEMRESPWDALIHHWESIGAPLRPCADDIQTFESAVRDWQKRRGAARVRALLLGVTPEIARMRWPSGTQLTAMDNNPEMIRKVWPGFPRPGQGAICADWRRQFFAKASFNVVVGDGCFTPLAYPGGYADLLHSIRHQIEPGGLLLIRHFMRPEMAETVEQVFTDLRTGRIGNFHIFKWRLAHSLHGDIKDGVRLAEVWNAWNQSGLVADELAARLNWPIAAVRTMDAYRGRESRYTFPVLSELRAVLEPAFAEASVQFGCYELGELCPIISHHAR